MDKELIKQFYTLRSTLSLMDTCRSETGTTLPLTLQEYTGMMSAYHSIQEVLSSIYKRESEFFDVKSY
jgi:hypothetical protein